MVVGGVVTVLDWGWVQQTWLVEQYLPLRLMWPDPSVMTSSARQRLLDTQVQLVVEDPGTITPTCLSERRKVREIRETVTDRL